MARARAAASPGSARDLVMMNSQADVRDVLPAVQAPTLVIHRVGDRDARVEEGRYIAAHIPGARFVELPGDTHVPFWEPDDVVDEIEEFLTGVRPTRVADRVLATILFTDLVGSTERAGALGDHAWAELLEHHHQLVRRELARFGGEEIDTAGDGFLALFDGPARAIRCALAIRDGLAELGLEVRAGVHTGEVERPRGGGPRGIAVHTGARIAAAGSAGDVLVSATTRDLVAGSGLEFADSRRSRAEGHRRAPALRGGSVTYFRLGAAVLVGSAVVFSLWQLSASGAPSKAAYRRLTSSDIPGVFHGATARIFLASLRAENRFVCAQASERRMKCADVFTAFNGSDGSRDPRAAGLIVADGHPSAKGSATIAKVVVGTGFAPLR